MGRLISKMIVMGLMLLGLPLAGVWLAGGPLGRYLEFPPTTRYVAHAPFAWAVFALYTLVILAVLLPLAWMGWRGWRRRPPPPPGRRPGRFPAWGWAGLAAGAASWLLAWNRFEWFAPFQAHTFTPLWLSYIVVANALCHWRSGRCLLTHRPVFLLVLFPFSALFWWFFEYLNRFVQNWYYTGVHYGPWAYFWLATLPFSTVLPAVLSTSELLSNASWLQRAFANGRPVTCGHPRVAAAVVLGAAGAGLAGIGVWPDLLFALLWVSPLLMLLALQTLFGAPHLLHDLARGDWRRFAAAALAALVCGFFWEMWNTHSLARWEYAVPFVQRFTVFEMPLLGYAGYLPFGLECVVVGDLLAGASGRRATLR
jgi:hypothetical protein